jgi:hypothetical protein
LNISGILKDIKADEGILDPNGLPDITKVEPVIYDSAGPGYYALGDFLGKCYSVGRKK